MRRFNDKAQTGAPERSTVQSTGQGNKELLRSMDARIVLLAKQLLLLQDKWAYILYLLTLLSSVAFFNPFGIIQETRFPARVFEVMVVISGIYSLKKSGRRSFKGIPAILFWMFILMSFVSMIMAQRYHNQSVRDSFFATFPIIGGYLYFIILLRFRIPSKVIVKTIKTFIVISTIVYFVNLIAIPYRVFEWGRYDVESTRGMARLWIPFISLHVFSFFYHIHLYTSGNSTKATRRWIFLGAVMILLSLTRQYIFVAYMLGGLMFMSRMSLSRKGLFVVFLFLAVFVLPRIQIVQNLVSLSNTQLASLSAVEQNERVRAFYYFTKEEQVNRTTELFGNGVPSMGYSEWGKRIEIVKKQSGYTLADIGWTGIFFYFGWAGILLLLAFFLYTAFIKVELKYKYCKYWIIYIVLISIASAPVTYSYEVLSISTILYLVYNSRRERLLVRIALEKSSIAQSQS